jgi:hypothetical protein
LKYTYLLLTSLLTTILIGASPYINLANAQSTYSTPNPTTPPGDTEHFPRGTDLKVYERAKETIEKVYNNLDVGEDAGTAINNKFGDATHFDHDAFPEQEERFDGSEAGITDAWTEDSEKILDMGEDAFYACFTPKKLADTCEYCEPAALCPYRCGCLPNNGYTWSYWWPEAIIEVNEFGVTAIEKPQDFASGLDPVELAKALDANFKPDDVDPFLEEYGVTELADLPSELRAEPNLGRTQWEGPNVPQKILAAEGHAWRTKLAQGLSQKRCQGCGIDHYHMPPPYCPQIETWYNGYLYGNIAYCFLDTTPVDGNSLFGWTEELNWAPYWRLPGKSETLDEEIEDDQFTKIDQPSADLLALGIPTSTPGDPLGLVSNTTYHKSESCAAYRAHKWEDDYGDLEDAVGIVPYDNDDMEHICYKGGGQLYPPVGALFGHFTPLVSAGFLARRAIELFSRTNKYPGGPSGTEERYENRLTLFDDRVDKLQRVYPEFSEECFKIEDIDDWNTDMFPPDLVKETHTNSIRYVYWNRRVACTCQLRGTTSAEELERSDSDWVGDYGWGCQIAYKDDEWKSAGDSDWGDILGGDLATSSGSAFTKPHDLLWSSYSGWMNSATPVSR